MFELYLPMFIMFAVAAVICGAMFSLGALLGPKNPTREKMMPFECGNDTEGAKGSRPSVKFYLTAILFVVFDIEVVFMYPWAVVYRDLLAHGHAALALGSMLSFLGVLFIGYLYALKKGAFNWKE